MRILGSRIRYRRRQLGLAQKQVGSQNTASFVSKVENDQALPSLSLLDDWSITLETTVSDLIGDRLLWEAAALTVLHPEKCHHYLAFLPETQTRQYLEALSTSASSLSTPVPQPPPCPHLQYLAAKVLLHRNEMDQAAVICQQALDTCDLVWRIHHLALLCQIWSRLGHIDEERAARSQLLTALSELNTEKAIASLPEADILTAAHIDLIKLSALYEIILHDCTQ